MGCYYMTMDVPDRKNEGMTFGSMAEVEMAHALGVVDTHSKVKLKLPPTRRLKTEDERVTKPGAIITTTACRVLFKQILADRMYYYNTPMRSSEQTRVIFDR